MNQSFIHSFTETLLLLDIYLYIYHKQSKLLRLTNQKKSKILKKIQDKRAGYEMKSYKIKRVKLRNLIKILIFFYYILKSS
jgi:hypothetical protein